MTRQQYIAELHSLLGFMSDEDRQRTIEKYTRMFNKAQDEEEFMGRLGTPTRLAIKLAGEYVPSTPEQRAEEDAEREMYEAQNTVLADAAVTEEETAEIVATSDAEEPVAEEEAPAAEAAEEPVRTQPKRRVKGGLLTIYTLLSIIIGLPIMLLLILVGIPFIAAGVGLIAGMIMAVPNLLAPLSLFSDMALIIGGALAVGAVALVIVWFGLWLSITLARLWLGGVIIRLGAKLCIKEADAV